MMQRRAESEGYLGRFALLFGPVAIVGCVNVRDLESLLAGDPGLLAALGNFLSKNIGLDVQFSEI